MISDKSTTQLSFEVVVHLVFHLVYLAQVEHTLSNDTYQCSVLYLVYIA